MMKALIVCFAITILSALAFAADEHPDDMGTKECITCHADKDAVSKPEVVKEYNQSRHSYTGVACGNCHGDEKDFVAKPTKAACQPCHAEQVAVTKSDLTCEKCHIVHSFSVHKM